MRGAYRNTAKTWVRVVFRRRLLISFLILFQVGFLLALIGGSGRTFRYVSWSLNVLSILVCLSILNKKEKSAYKLTWIFLILMVPLFGGILYVFFRSQSNPRKLRRQISRANALCRPHFHLTQDALSALIQAGEACIPQVRYLQEYAGFPVYIRTQCRYFNSGEAFYTELLAELAKAERYIFLEFFILRQGKMLHTILDILEQKARQGLDVRLIYDDLGCFMSVPSNYKDYLASRGVRCMVFNPFKPILSSLQNNRDHRKIVSIDGKTAFTGGINLGDEYINSYKKYGHWKDSAVMLRGEAAWSLTLIFLHMWNLGRAAEDKPLAFYPWTDGPCPVPSDGYVQPYADSPIDDENVGEHVYIQIINNAKKYVYINTPYLVVDDNLLSALTLAAKSGVDVRIITPHRWDKWVVQILSRSYYRQLIAAGVKIYEYTAGFNHSKTFVSDDKVATVGTTNLDYRSLYLHFECGVWVYQSRIVQEVKEDFLRTIPISQRITLADCSRNALLKFMQNVFKIIAPLT